MSSELKAVPLGDTGLEASVIGYGTYHLLDKLNAYDAIESLGAAHQAGVTLFDTSDNYGTELAIGKAVSEGVLPRDEVVIATKTGLAATVPEVRVWGDRHANTEPSRVRQQVEKSLWTLGDDVGPIDLYQLHVHDPTVPAVDIASTLNDLISEGKILSYGVSNYGAEALRELIDACDSNGLARPVSLQPFHNILSSAGTESAIDLAREHGMTILAHSPLHKGALTNKGVTILDGVMADADARYTKPEELEQLVPLKVAFESIKLLKEYAADHDKGLAEMALAWLAMQENTVVLTACTRPTSLATAVAAPQWTIDNEGLALIEEVRGSSLVQVGASKLLSLMRSINAY